ncbi:MAG: GntR family transcriptional regulator [Acidobacteria bacterium]|nr:GntR family transcriptional regulator [Acidobacteriota bacterium]
MRFSAPYQRSGLAEKAYLILRDRILKGQLPLGSSLSRRALANELGVSLLPISEALQRLESDGLVESRPRVGTRVCDPTPEEIRERYEVREALESQAARLFAARAGVRDRLHLVREAESMDAMFNRCTTSTDHDPEFLYAVHSFHSQLHLRIAEGAQCGTLHKAIERNQVLIFNWLYDVAAHRPSLPPSFHYDLATSIANGTPEEADRAMRTHIRYGLENVLQSFARDKGAKSKQIRRVK